jgi:hypothetical protein
MLIDVFRLAEWCIDELEHLANGHPIMEVMSQQYPHHICYRDPPDGKTGKRSALPLQRSQQSYPTRARRSRLLNSVRHQ